LYFTFLNGSAEQKGSFSQAINESFATWSDHDDVWGPEDVLPSLATRVEVEFVDDLPAGIDAETSCAFDGLGMTARIEIRNTLDPLAGQGGEPFRRTVLHECGHIAIARLVLDDRKEFWGGEDKTPTSEQRIQKLCDLFGAPRSAWDSGPWFDQVQEAVAETVKDMLIGFAYVALLPNRSNLHLQLSGATETVTVAHTPLGASTPILRSHTYPAEWVEFCRQFQGPPIVPEHGLAAADELVAWQDSVASFGGFFPGSPPTYRGLLNPLRYVSSYAGYRIEFPDGVPEHWQEIRLTLSGVGLTVLSAGDALATTGPPEPQLDGAITLGQGTHEGGYPAIASALDPGTGLGLGPFEVAGHLPLNMSIDLSVVQFMPDDPLEIPWRIAPYTYPINPLWPPPPWPYVDAGIVTIGSGVRGAYPTAKDRGGVVVGRRTR
jgi:hypothetical protein